MTSYETRPNDYETVSKCEYTSENRRVTYSSNADFYNKFGAIHQHLTPNKSRELFSKMPEWFRLAFIDDLK